MIKKTAIILGLTLAAASAFAGAPSSLSGTFVNNTSDYVFFLEGSTQGVQPGQSVPFTLNDQQTLKLTMDNAKKASPWKVSGYGNGGIAYSVDPTQQNQSNFTLNMGPASVTGITTPAPTFAISGQVTGSATDDFSKGFTVTEHSVSSDNTLKIVASE